MKISKPLLRTIAAAVAAGAISTSACTKATDLFQSKIDNSIDKLEKLKLIQNPNGLPDDFSCAACGMG